MFLQIEIGTQMKIPCDYAALREDEISVSRGELVEILETDNQGSYLVHRPANDHTPAAEGWVPSHVLLSSMNEGGVR